MKDAFENSGLAPAEEIQPKQKGRPEWREPLPEDQSLPPLFEKPALTKPADSRQPGEKAK